MAVCVQTLYLFPLTESLPKPWPRMKPSPQRRAISVHEDALLQQAALLDPEGELVFQSPHPKKGSGFNQSVDASKSQ